MLLTIAVLSWLTLIKVVWDSSSCIPLSYLNLATSVNMANTFFSFSHTSSHSPLNLRVSELILTSISFGKTNKTRTSLISMSINELKARICTYHMTCNGLLGSRLHGGALDFCVACKIRNHLGSHPAVNTNRFHLFASCLNMFFFSFGMALTMWTRTLLMLVFFLPKTKYLNLFSTAEIHCGYLQIISASFSEITPLSVFYAWRQLNQESENVVHSERLDVPNLVQQIE